MHKLIIKSNRGWPAHSGHPWLFRDDVTHLPGVEDDGAEAEVYDARGDYVGRGLLAARSQIVCRIYSRKRDEELDREFFRRRILAARERRTALGLPGEDTDSFRLVYAEGDRLPGLTIDKYADYLVIQTPTPGLDQRKAMLVELLSELFQPRGICERNDMPLRKSDCLPQVAQWIVGPAGGEDPHSRKRPAVRRRPAGGDEDGSLLRSARQPAHGWPTSAATRKCWTCSPIPAASASPPPATAPAA